MIGRESYSGSFRELADYLHAGADGRKAGRIEWLETRNVWGPTAQDAAAVMSALASGSPTGKPVYHLSVSFDVGDTVDRAVMRRVADRVLADLGLDSHQAVIVAHNDRDHAHFHLMVNRVDAETGRVWKIDFSMREVERSLRHLEREVGLRENPGHLFRLPGQVRPDRSVSRGAGVLRRAERTGERPYVERARDEIAIDLAEAASYDDLDARLAAKGHRLEARNRGLVVTDGRGVFAAVSAVSSTASLYKLEQRFGESYGAYGARRAGRRGDRAGWAGAGDRPDGAGSGHPSRWC